MVAQLTVQLDGRLLWKCRSMVAEVVEMSELPQSLSLWFRQFRFRLNVGSWPTKYQHQLEHHNDVCNCRWLISSMSSSPMSWSRYSRHRPAIEIAVADVANASDPRLIATPLSRCDCVCGGFSPAVVDAAPESPPCRPEVLPQRLPWTKQRPTIGWPSVGWSATRCEC